MHEKRVSARLLKKKKKEKPTRKIVQAPPPVPPSPAVNPFKYIAGTTTVKPDVSVIPPPRVTPPTSFTVIPAKKRKQPSTPLAPTTPAAKPPRKRSKTWMEKHPDVSNLVTGAEFLLGGHILGKGLEYAEPYATRAGIAAIEGAGSLARAGAAGAGRIGRAAAAGARSLGRGAARGIEAIRQAGGTVLERGRELGTEMMSGPARGSYAQMEGLGGPTYHSVGGPESAPRRFMPGEAAEAKAFTGPGLSAPRQAAAAEEARLARAATLRAEADAALASRTAERAAIATGEKGLIERGIDWFKGLFTEGGARSAIAGEEAAAIEFAEAAPFLLIP